MTKQEALPQIAAAAVACERATGVPAELSAAQCALESGWLQHAPMRNCFGIKATTGQAGQLLNTAEWFTDAEVAAFLRGRAGRTAQLKYPGALPRNDGRREYEAQDWFAVYATLADCFAAHAALFSQHRYAVAIGQASQRGEYGLEGYVRAIGPIYATVPNYADQVLAIARQADVVAALNAARLTS